MTDAKMELDPWNAAIEAAAKAIAERHDPGTWNYLLDDEKSEYCAHARAAISAYTAALGDAQWDAAIMAALGKAVQLVDIATDWNLSEVEIDGNMVHTYTLGAEFRALLKGPGR